MQKLFERSVFFMFTLMVFAASQGLVPLATYGQESDNVIPPSQIVQTNAEIIAYWTPERMAAAEANPYPMPTFDASQGEVSTEFSASPGGTPGVVNGTLPLPAYRNAILSDDSPGWREGEIVNGTSENGQVPQYGGPPGDWQTSYPGPFQRWTWFGRYLTYPTSTIGKIFFTQDHDGNGSSSNFVCSGSVVYAGGPQHDVIATAGHCVNNGLDGAGVNNGWSYNMMFYPSYNAGGVNPVSGGWAQKSGVSLVTKSSWYSNGNPEGDVGCMIAANTGTQVNTHVGNFTGTLGRAWNWGADEPEFSFGYPAGSPFPGYHIIAVVGPEWYTYNWGSQADSKYMGNDMTGGSSGGPWILGWGHRSAEYTDTDGSNATDPLPNGSGWLNGVNSHKIIVNGTTRSQEMGSPQFTNSSNPGPNTESLWSACQGYANAD